jgi:hypothetical protein
MAVKSNVFCSKQCFLKNRSQFIKIDKASFSHNIVPEAVLVTENLNASAGADSQGPNDA